MQHSFLRDVNQGLLKRAMGLLLVCVAVAACKTDDAAQLAPTTSASDHKTTHSAETPNALDATRGPLRALLPPSTPGESKVALEGCLKEGARSEADGERFPAPAENTRSKTQESPVQLSVLGDGVLVSHTLSHACCLSAEVVSKLDGQALKITETLSGTPCRCRCQSRIQTAVGLPLGTYQVEVEVVAPNQDPSIVHTQDVEVKALRSLFSEPDK